MTGIILADAPAILNRQVLLIPDLDRLDAALVVLRQRGDEIAQFDRVSWHPSAAIRGVEARRTHDRDQQLQLGFADRADDRIQLAPNVASSWAFLIAPVNLLANPAIA